MGAAGGRRAAGIADRRRWGVSLMAGYGWAGKWTPFVGVGVSYNLFRF